MNQKRSITLSIQNLSKVFNGKTERVVAVDDVSFDVSEGDLFTLLCPGVERQQHFDAWPVLNNRPVGKFNFWTGITQPLRHLDAISEWFSRAMHSFPTCRSLTMLLTD